MTDVVDRLRVGPHVQHTDKLAMLRVVAIDTDTMREAAAEIERLRNALRILTGNTFHDALCLAFEDGSWEHDAFDQAKTLAGGNVA